MKKAFHNIVLSMNIAAAEAKHEDTNFLFPGTTTVVTPTSS